jgi:hypothetical protein
METYEHTIHGLVTIRLLNAPPGILRSIESVFGPPSGSAAEPDLSVSFVDEIPTRGRSRLLGLREAAFDEEDFYLLDQGGRRSRLDFETLGEKTEIICERGVHSVPFLLPAVGLRLLRKGHILLHSCAFRYRDRAALVSGWQKGGKTEMLLAFMAAGAEYLSDEWTILDGDGKSVFGLPGIVQVWDWHLRELPDLTARLRPAERARMTLSRAFQAFYHRWPRVPDPAGFPGDLLQRLSLKGGNSLVGQVRVPPERFFGDRIARTPTSLDRVFLATSSESKTTIQPVSGAEVAARMAASLRWERRRLLAAYEQFRFAFPHRRSSWLERANEEEAALLSKALADREAYEITHPYPVSLRELFEVAAPLFAE